jgi:hypothetical protein
LIDLQIRGAEYGIDDSLNQYLDNHGVSKYDSNPDTYSGGGDETPVPTGVIEGVNITNQTASKGFCAGDDESEYYRVQRCSTDLCETDTSIKGVAGDPDKCLLDQGEVSGVSGNERILYDEGDNVTVSFSSNSETMACFGGVWHDEWPITTSGV